MKSTGIVAGFTYAKCHSWFVYVQQVEQRTDTNAPFDPGSLHYLKQNIHSDFY